MPETHQEVERKDMVALRATVQALRTLDSPKAKAEYLLQALTKRPSLSRWLRLCYDGGYDFGNPLGYVRTLCSRDDWAERDLGHWQGLWLVLREVGCGNIHQQIASMAWSMHVATWGDPDLLAVAISILNRDLGCGLEPWVIDRVFAKLGKPTLQYLDPADKPVPCPTDLDKINDCGPRGKGVWAGRTCLLLTGPQNGAYVMGALKMDNNRVADITVIRNCWPHVKLLLEEAGIAIKEDTDPGFQRKPAKAAPKEEDIPF